MGSTETARVYRRSTHRTGGMKICSKCQEAKPPTREHFPPSRAYLDGLSCRCRSCGLNSHRRWRKTYPERHRSNNLRRYGLNTLTYGLILQKQGQSCAICGERAAADRRLEVDHDHATNRIRGLLCSKCNNGLARFRDDPNLLRIAIDYLQNRKQPIAC